MKINEKVKNMIILQLSLLGLVFLDQITKFLAVKYLTGTEGVSIIGDFFRFDLLYNQNAAFGILHTWPLWAKATLSVVSFIALEFYLIFKTPNEKLYQWCLVFIASGAIGNGIDRIGMAFFGGQGVVDFLHFNFQIFDFPIFNVADIYVTCTALFLLVYFIFSKDNSEPTSKELKEAARKIEDENLDVDEIVDNIDND